jgi:hypothetical protein
LEKISRGDFSKGIFLKFKGSDSFVDEFVIGGVSVPKAIPHFQRAPYSSEGYVNALFKALLYINVRQFDFFKESPNHLK